MSDRRRQHRTLRLCCTFAVAACALAPRIATAQTAVDLQRELDTLVPQLKAATAAFDSARRARTDFRPTVMIERGHLRLRVDSSLEAMTRTAAESASAALRRLFGARAAIASEYVIAVGRDSAVRGDRRVTIVRLRRIDPDPTSHRTGALRRAGNADRAVDVTSPEETHHALVVAIEALAAGPLHATLDDEMGLWFRAALPSTPESREELENVYVDLATASTELSRGCLGGDVRRCAQMLGLEPIADPIVEAYTAADRRQLVSSDATGLRVPAKAAEYDRCVGGLDDAACIARLRDRGAESLMSSYSTTAARRSFARWAITRGGDGAYARLHGSAGQPLLDRFAIVARMPADSVIMSWHAHLVSNRPAEPAIPPLTALATAMWIGVCGALALRSSRWR